MEPIPETRFVLTEMSRFADEDMTAQFTEMANRVAVLAPDCVGMTLSYVQEDLAFTWAATGLDVAALDAVQYLSHGPCVEAMQEGAIVRAMPSDPLDENRWLEFCKAENASGVESTLSVPLMEGRVVVGGVNFYGGTTTAFDGLHSELAAECGAWAGGAVTNADLSLSGVHRAKAAPGQMRDRFVEDQALGMIMAARRVDAEVAGQTLHDAAARAGIDQTELARIIVDSRLLQTP
jgi:transcriptional regulator with GAF, ATPase, and Fis domain